MRNLRYASFGLILLLIGCNIQDLDFNNLKVENLQSEVAVPFGTASYTMRELIEDISDSELELDEDPVTGELSLTYRDTASYTFTTDIFDIPDISNVSNLNIPDVPVDLMSTQMLNTTLSFYQVYESVEEEIIDSVFHADNSSLSIDIISTSNLNIDYTLELVNTLDVTTEIPMSFTGTLSGSNNNNHVQSLADYKTLFSEVSGENRFDVDLTIDVTVNPGESLNGDQIFVTIQFLDQDFIIAYGKMGQDTVAIGGERLDIALFDDLGQDGLEFGSPEITFDFRSSFGIPIGLGLGGLYAEESDGTQTFLGGSVVTNPRVIESASLDYPVTGDPVQTVITVDSKNSTLRDLLATSPATIGFDIEGFTNPYDDSALNFVTDTSTIRSYIEIVMPMEVRMTKVQRNLDFDLGGGMDFSSADSLTLRVITVNELPFSATMDIHIIDEAENSLYSVLDNQALEIPFLNFDRTVREPQTSIDDIPFGKTGIEALSSGDKLRVVITMDTPESQTAEEIFVKLLATAKLEVSLAARGIIDIDL